MEFIENISTDLMNILPGMFFRRNPNNFELFTSVSTGCEGLTGYKAGYFTGNGAVSFYTIVQANDRKRIVQEIAERLALQLPNNLEYWIICKDGKSKLVSEVSKGVYDQQQQLLYVEGFISEIKGKSNDEYLISTFTSFRNAINTGSIVSISDLKGIITFANDLFCKYSQYSLHELLGRNHNIVNSGHHTPEFFEDLWSTIKAGKIWRGEIKNKAKDGTYYWVDTVISPIFNERQEIVQYLSVRNIITNKKEYEQKLEKSESMLNEAQRIASIGCWELNLTDGTLFWTDEIYKIFEIDKSKFGATYEAFLNVIHPDDRESVNTAYTTSLKNKSPYSIVHRLLLADGSIKFVQENCITHYNDEGVPLRSVGTVQDITEIKVTENELLESRNLVQNIYDASIDAVVIVDDNGIITKWDKKAENLFGWAEHEVNGNNFKEVIFSKDWRRKYSNILAQFLNKGEAWMRGKTFDFTAIKKNGEKIEVALNVTATTIRGKTHFIGFLCDNSFRKKQEAKLKESEARFRSLFERNLAGVYLADLNDYIIDCNDAYAHIMGLNSAKEVRGKHARELYDNFSHENFVDFVRDRQGKITGYESLIRIKNGKYIYTLENASLIVDENQQPILMEGTVIDISDRIEADKLLLKSKQRYKSLLDNMNDGFYVDDVECKVTFANQRFCDFFGFTKEELYKVNMQDYIAPEYKDIIQERHRHRINGEDVIDHYEYEGLKKDGSRVWLEVRANSIVENGIPQGTQSVVRDITEKKKAEIEINKLAELNRKIIDSSDELFYVVDVKDQTSLCNPYIYISNKVEDFYGIDAQHMINEPGFWFNSIHQDDAPLLEQSNRQLLLSKAPVSRIYRVKHHFSGEYIWLYDFVKPILDATGEIKELYGSAKNITELKIKEAELNRTVGELNDRYNELMQFNYIVSHNLRTPIADIMGLADIMQMPTLSDDDKKVVIFSIQSSILKMDDLIKDLNDILATRSALNAKKTMVSIPALLHSIFDTLEKQIAETGTTIKTEIPENAREIFTIKSYLESSFYNLISNAIKYRSAARTPLIVISATKTDEELVLEVTDNGMGIDIKKHGDKVFGLYKRFNREVEGKGLGLHMTKTQIETLGGKIKVESEPGVGTTFVIRLPH